MKLAILSAIASAALATPLLASGDAAKGEADFKKCKACHSITAADGTDIVKGGKVGPNSSAWSDAPRAPWPISNTAT